MEKHWTIYCHTHIDSGRRYIGLTSQIMEKRWNQHTSKAQYSKNGRWHFPNAIRKYGKDVFFHEILEICNTLEAANVAEEKWIDHFDTRDPQFGFNLARGGDHVPHPIRKNPWDDPEYRAKVSTALKRVANSDIGKSIRAMGGAKSRGRICSDETRAKIALKSTGRIVSAETRARISATNTGRKLSPEHIEKTRKGLRRDFCKHGHSKHDAYIRSDGERICRVCCKKWNAKRYLKKPSEDRICDDRLAP